MCACVTHSQESKGAISKGQGAGPNEEQLAILLLRAGFVVVRELGFLWHRNLCAVSLVIKRQGFVCILKVVEGFILFPILLRNPVEELCAILLVLGVVPLIFLKSEVVSLFFHPVRPDRYRRTDTSQDSCLR